MRRKKLTAADFRRIALGMKDALEASHMDHPDFRVNGRIFATLHADMEWGMVKLTPEEQQRFVQGAPEAFKPENGAWGLQGCTAVRLDRVDEEILGEAPPGVAASRRNAPRIPIEAPACPARAVSPTIRPYDRVTAAPDARVPILRRFHVIGRWLSGCLAVGAAAAVFLDGPANTAPVFAQGTAPGVVAIRNGTIITATRGTIANGTVLIRDGKIAAVGTNVSIPSGADVYDATGKFVSPGLIDAHSHIANDAINEGSVSVSSMTGMEDVLDPRTQNLSRSGRWDGDEHPA
jgi:hypothetical protein